MKHYAIIGRPISHSIAGQWFSKRFRELSIDADFRMIIPAETEMKDFRTWVLDNKFDGLLVTIPLKMDVMRFLDEIDEQAKEIHAVNMISVTDGKLKGYNTDHVAFESQIKRVRPDGFKKAIIMGIGGAAAAVIYALKRNGIEFIKVSRRKEFGDILYNELTESDFKDADLIINTTPLGMAAYKNDFPPLNYSLINNNALAFDLIYNPEQTVFLKKCAEIGCQTENGMGMVEFVYERAMETWGLTHEA
ncbi:MAG: hypothetical protein A2W93_11190 [Bacteroidetes bacterium GWF2_43_63]|nr:MAG: hypothetical protein A2W94_14065 [Bacteroidetes bacterium GWE2_42_42]OFY54838.1 MAG: hypothetical protein A2W93_11190 [Bacteroidetes bacterium GWF2_43_63]HCB63259.1 shikimate dehydrogenase [Bacteroidales bacterium]HCY22001.1 shikimate dehydrogenase [Bacteroidales bacterium]